MTGIPLKVFFLSVNSRGPVKTFYRQKLRVLHHVFWNKIWLRDKHFVVVFSKLRMKINFCVNLYEMAYGYDYKIIRQAINFKSSKTKLHNFNSFLFLFRGKQIFANFKSRFVGLVQLRVYFMPHSVSSLWDPTLYLLHRANAIISQPKLIASFCTLRKLGIL